MEGYANDSVQPKTEKLLGGAKELDQISCHWLHITYNSSYPALSHALSNFGVHY